MTFTRTGLSPAMARLSRRFRFIKAATGLVRVRSPLLAESRLMSFPPGTEMFQFPGFASPTYGFSRTIPLRAGFPHSEIHGSKDARPSPGLSQRATSFIASQCQGIHQMPLSRLIRSSSKRHAQRQVPAPFAQSLRSLSTFRIADRRHPCDVMNAIVFETKTTGAMASRKDPAYGQPHFPIHDVKDRDELAIAAGQTPAHRSSSSQNRHTLRTPPRSASPIVGGGDRIRTDDLLLAKQVLSQLSYSPIQIPGIRCQVSDHLMPDPCHLASENWWAREDLNLRPHAYQARALTS